MITLIVQEDVEPTKEGDYEWSQCPRRASSSDGDWYRRHSLERGHRRTSRPVERLTTRVGCYEKGHRTPATPKKYRILIATHFGDYTHPVREDVSEEAKAFSVLATQWEEETRNLSSPSAKASHPSYDAIVKMGRPVLPLIFQRMRFRPAFWFDALRRITGEDPVTPPMRGNVQRMTEAWLSWGEKRGYGASR